MKIAAAFSIIAFACVAGASGFFHQPGDNQRELTVHGGYRVSSIHQKGSATNDDLKGMDSLGVKYAWGIGNSMALSADLSYSSFKAGSPEVNQKGFEPLALNFQGTNRSLVYGADGHIGIEKAKDGNDVNRSYGDPIVGIGRGGLGITPYVGVQAPAGAGTAGARLSYDLLKLDTEANANSGTTTIKGGNRMIVSVFYETATQSGIPIGASLSWIDENEIKASSNGGPEGQMQSPQTLMALTAYTQISSGSGAFIPSFGYTWKVSSDSYDTLNDTRLTLAYRAPL